MDKSSKSVIEQITVDQIDMFCRHLPPGVSLSQVEMGTPDDISNGKILSRTKNGIFLVLSNGRYTFAGIL